jgi:hypothetical protein
MQFELILINVFFPKSTEKYKLQIRNNVSAISTFSKCLHFCVTPKLVLKTLLYTYGNLDKVK